MKPVNLVFRFNRGLRDVTGQLKKKIFLVRSSTIHYIYQIASYHNMFPIGIRVEVFIRTITELKKFILLQKYQAKHMFSCVEVPFHCKTKKKIDNPGVNKYGS